MAPEGVLSPEPGIDHGRVDRVAAAAVDHWARLVRPLPLSVEDEGERQALQALVAWYERVRIDRRYSNPPPAEGLEALFALDGRQIVASRRSTGAAVAVRVAGELAAFRRRQREGPGEGGVTEALARLELAIASAGDRLDQGRR